MQILVPAQDSYILNDGSQPELGSVLLQDYHVGMLVWDNVFHMFVAKPAHVLELAIVVHFLRISQRHLVDLCCKLSFFFLRLDKPGIS